MRFSKLNSQVTFKIFAITYFLLLILSWLVYWDRLDPYVRPCSYFVILALMGGVVFLEITMVKIEKLSHKIIIFVQIFLISFSFNTTQLLLYPTVTGIDPWGHKTLTLLTIWKGHLPDYATYPFEAQPYIRMPGFHMLVGTQILSSGLSYKWASFTAVGMTSLILEMTLVYLLVVKLSGNIKLALLSVLLTATADNVLSMTGISIIPNTIGIALALLMLYPLITRNESFFSNIKLLIASFVVATGLVFTHTVSYAFVLAQTLIGGIILILTAKDRKVVTSVGLWITLLGVLALFEWGLISERYLGSAVQIFKNLFIYGVEDIKTYENKVAVPLKYVILARAGMILYFALTSIMLVSSFFKTIKNIKNRKDRNILSLIIITGMFIGVGGIAFLTPALSGIAHRYWYYGEILGSVFVASLFCSAHGINKRQYITNRVIHTILVGILLYLMFVASVSNDDNPLVKDYSSRTGLYDSEVAAAYFVISSSPAPIATDFLYIRNIFYMHTWTVKAPQKLPAKYPKSFKQVIKENGYYFILRVQLVKNRYFPLGGRWSSISYPPLNNKIRDVISHLSIVKNIPYNNKNVIVFG